MSLSPWSSSQSVLGRALRVGSGALHHRHGDVLRDGHATGARHAHLDGFDLHAALRVAGHDRRRLEHLCRSLLRPPVAQERLRLLADGRVLVQLKRVWADGTSHLLFEPLEFLEKLAALTPRPRINLILYHGVLGPHAAVTLCILSSNARNLEGV